MFFKELVGKLWDYSLHVSIVRMRRKYLQSLERKAKKKTRRTRPRRTRFPKRRRRSRRKVPVKRKVKRKLRRLKARLMPRYNATNQCDFWPERNSWISSELFLLLIRKLRQKSQETLRQKRNRRRRNQKRKARSPKTSRWSWSLRTYWTPQQLTWHPQRKSKHSVSRFYSYLLLSVLAPDVLKPFLVSDCRIWQTETLPNGNVRRCSTLWRLLSSRLRYERDRDIESNFFVTVVVTALTVVLWFPFASTRTSCTRTNTSWWSLRRTRNRSQPSWGRRPSGWMRMATLPPLRSSGRSCRSCGASAKICSSGWRSAASGLSAWPPLRTCWTPPASSSGQHRAKGSSGGGIGATLVLTASCVFTGVPDWFQRMTRSLLRLSSTCWTKSSMKPWYMFSQEPVEASEFSYFLKCQRTDEELCHLLTLQWHDEVATLARHDANATEMLLLLWKILAIDNSAINCNPKKM